MKLQVHNMIHALEEEVGKEVNCGKLIDKEKKYLLGTRKTHAKC